ncbi:MAG TPA: helix-turn-helix transcriptional regulator, partial [Candidatus Angelobacter sp.]|nr:helix-turn-helix transcriptional regulator [Candidatus Angelobacter sp.]
AKIGFASPYHFTRTFRSVTGLPPLHFLSALRLDAARTLLLHTRRKVIDICYDVGYSSVGTFTRKFTDSFGVSPRQFRALAQSPRHAIRDHQSLPSSHARLAAIQDFSGHVIVPSGFKGIVCVGLFATPIPQSKPLACTIAARNGDYQMPDAPQGKSFLFALGMELPIQVRDCFCHDSVLRAGGQAVYVSRDNVSGDTDLVLRAPLPTDAPILLFLADLVQRTKTARQNVNTAGPIPDLDAILPGGRGDLERAERISKAL